MHLGQSVSGGWGPFSPFRERKRTSRKRTKRKEAEGSQPPQTASVWTNHSAALMEQEFYLSSPPREQIKRCELSRLHNPPVHRRACSIQQNTGRHGHQVMQQVHMCKQVVFQTIGAVWQSSISHTVHCANKACLCTHSLGEMCRLCWVFKKEIQMKIKEIYRGKINTLAKLTTVQPKMFPCLTFWWKMQQSFDIINLEEKENLKRE